MNDGVGILCMAVSSHLFICFQPMLLQLQAICQSFTHRLAPASLFRREWVAPVATPLWAWNAGHIVKVDGLGPQDATTAS